MGKKTVETLADAIELGNKGNLSENLSAGASIFGHILTMK